MSQIKYTMELLKVRVGKYYPEFLGKDDIQIIEKLFNVISSYPVHLVEVKAGKYSQKLVIKFAPFGNDYCEGLVEYNNMRHLQENSCGKLNNIGLINCLDYIQECNALVTEYVEGERFSNWFLKNNIIFSNKVKKQKIGYYIKIAGSWLNNFHRSNQYPNIKVKNSNIADSFASLLSSAKSIGLLKSITYDIEEKMQSKIKDLEDYVLPMSLIHGDYGLQNINIHKDKIYAFDLQRDYQESIFYDVAYFCVTLVTLNTYPKHLYFDHAYSIKLKEKFIEGYFERRLDKEEKELLDIYTLLNLLQRCIKQYQNQHKKFGRYTAVLVWLLNIKFETIIRKLLLQIKLENI